MYKSIASPRLLGHSGATVRTSLDLADVPETSLLPWCSFIVTHCLFLDCLIFCLRFLPLHGHARSSAIGAGL